MTQQSTQVVRETTVVQLSFIPGSGGGDKSLPLDILCVKESAKHACCNMLAAVGK